MLRSGIVSRPDAGDDGAPSARARPRASARGPGRVRPIATCRIYPRYVHNVNYHM